MFFVFLCLLTIPIGDKWSSLYQIFRIDWHMGVDDQSDIRLTITRGELLW